MEWDGVRATLSAFNSFSQLFKLLIPFWENYFHVSPLNYSIVELLGITHKKFECILQRLLEELERDKQQFLEQ